MTPIMLAALHLYRQNADIPLQDKVQFAMTVRIVVVQLEAVSRQLLCNRVLIDRPEVDVGLPVEDPKLYAPFDAPNECIKKGENSPSKTIC